MKLMRASDYMRKVLSYIMSAVFVLGVGTIFFSVGLGENLAISANDIFKDTSSTVSEPVAGGEKSEKGEKSGAGNIFLEEDKTNAAGAGGETAENDKTAANTAVSGKDKPKTNLQTGGLYPSILGTNESLFRGVACMLAAVCLLIALMLISKVVVIQNARKKARLEK